MSPKFFQVILRRPAAMIPVTLLAVAFVIRVTTAIHYPNIYFPDEIFQTQEIGHRLAFGNGTVTWEWREGIRSFVFPYLLSLLMRATVWIGPGSSGYLLAITVAMCSLSLSLVWFCYRWALRTAGQLAAVVSGGTAAVWFSLVYFSAKTLSEVIATDAFLPAILIGTAVPLPTKQRLALSGFLFGLAVALRPQLLPTACFAAVWICWAEPRKRLPVIAAAAFLPILIFGGVDAFTLRFPFASFIRYAWVNVGQNRASVYGTSPAYFYVLELLRFCGPLVIPAIWGVRKSPFLGWLLLVLVGSHSVLPHKEFRFVFLAVPIVLTLFGIGCGEALHLFQKRFGEANVARMLTCGVLLLVILSSVFLGKHFDHWHAQEDEIRFADALSRDPAACGVAYFGMGWQWTGGYTHLHRNIPIIATNNERELARDSGQYNALMTSKRLALTPQGFSPVSCGSSTCTYRRPGSCSVAGPDELNASLRRSNR